MHLRPKSGHLAFSAFAIALAGCGGGGSSGAAFTPSPPATPAPTPTPTGTPAPFGLASSKQFAAFGVLNRSDAGAYNVNPTDPNAIKFGWSAEARAYEVTVPGFSAAELSLTFPGNNDLAFTASDATGNKLPLAFSVLRSGDGGLKFSYSSLGYYSTYPTGATQPYLSAQFAYGLPTITGDVPTTGTANYDASIFGVTTSNNGYDIRGDARLTFDFAAGSLSGYMRPRLFSDWDGVDRPLAQYNFTQTVYSVGSLSFSGRFDVSNAASASEFQGQFTGPGAAELIAGWRAPYLDPFDNTWKAMGGVWLGKKQ